MNNSEIFFGIRIVIRDSKNQYVTTDSQISLKLKNVPDNPTIIGFKETSLFYQVTVWFNRCPYLDEKPTSSKSYKNCRNFKYDTFNWREKSKLYNRHKKIWIGICLHQKMVLRKVKNSSIPQNLAQKYVCLRTPIKNKQIDEISIP